MSDYNITDMTDATDTIFTNLPRPFPEDFLNDKFKTTDILNVTTNVIFLLQKCGKLFAPIIHDMQINMQIIQSKYETNPENFVFLDDIINEALECDEMLPADSVKWLARELHFVQTFIKMIVVDSDVKKVNSDIGRYVKIAYKNTLERYHGWLGLQLFNILVRFAPTKKHLFYIFALERYDEHLVLNHMRSFIEKLDNCMKILNGFYRNYELELSE